jgi:hypothetical protein
VSCTGILRKEDEMDLAESVAELYRAFVQWGTLPGQNATTLLLHPDGSGDLVDPDTVLLAGWREPADGVSQLRALLTSARTRSESGSAEP